MNYIWGIADDVLRDSYVRQLPRRHLPMTMLLRLAAASEGTKQPAFDMDAALDGNLFPASDEGQPTVVDYKARHRTAQTKQSPPQKEGGIEALLQRDALPWAPDAGYQRKSVKTAARSVSPTTKAKADADTGRDPG